MIYGLRAIVGMVAHDVAHRVGWIAGYPLPSDREADDVVVARGLVYSLLAAKRALEGLRPNKVLEGYISKELLEKIRSYDLLLMALMDEVTMHHFSTDRTSVRY